MAFADDDSTTYLLESDHNYANSSDITYSYTLDGDDAATYGIAVTFNDETKVESGYDYLYIYDGDDTLLGTYTGTTLAGATIYVPQSNTVKVRLVSDSSVNYYGFAVTEVTALTSNDLEVCGAIETIAPAELVDGVATPDVTVTYGAKTLVEGEDYVVSFTGNTKVGTDVATAVVVGQGDYEGVLTATFSVYDSDSLLSGAAITADQAKSLRLASSSGTTSVTMTDVDDSYIAAITSVTVAEMAEDENLDAIYDADGNLTWDEAVELDEEQYTMSSSSITFNRTGDDPIFNVEPDEGDPYLYSSRWGSYYMPNSAYYQITIEAAGYETVTGIVQVYTGASDTFSIIIDEDGDDSTTDDQTVAYTWTTEELEALDEYGFTNASSQCGMTGFRTFSGMGVTLNDLLEIAGVEVYETDTYLLDTTDDYGTTKTYDDLFGSQRYFLSGIYTDEDVQEQAVELMNSDDDDASIELRKLLAESALADPDNSEIDPMITTNYTETILYSDEVVGAELPTEDNTEFIEAVGLENQYRFLYGITIEQYEETLTFETGDGSAVESQTVLSNPMTSSTNTTSQTTYWTNSLVIYRNSAEVEEEEEVAETITVPDDPTSDYGTFAGWYTDEDCTDGNEFDFTANNGTIDQDTTLYAKWDEYLLQSDHNYSNSSDVTYTYTCEDEGASTYGIAVTFNDSTKVESGYDYLYIYDGDDNLIGTYTGTTLAGQTIYIPGSDTIKVQLTSDSSVNYYGFAITDVTALTSNDLSLCGAIEAIEATELVDGVATPDVTVTYGTATLVEGTDYTLEVSGNTTTGTDVGTVTVTGIGDYTGTLTATFSIYDSDNLLSYVSIADQGTSLRMSSSTGTTSITLTDADDAYISAITSVSMAEMAEDENLDAVYDSDGNLTWDEAVELTSDQYTLSTSSITLNRTADDPIINIEPGEGDPYVGSRYTYPNSAYYQITIEATGYETVTGIVQYYTGASDTFSIIVVEDGVSTTVATWTSEELEALDEYGFTNASSQCGMTGFRTFSGMGVTLNDLLDIAGVEVYETDTYLLDTTDGWGTTKTYDDLFGSQRYFLSGIYTDEDVQEQAVELMNSDDDDASIELRKLLAESALADPDNSEIDPMITTNYTETILYSDEVVGAELPTEDNTEFVEAVGLENQYRFLYGITIEQYEETVTFETGDGSEVESQTVLSNPMTSSTNTTSQTTYWTNSLVIYRDAVEVEEEEEVAETITAPEDPTLEGYVFGGWYTDEDCTDGNEFDFTANNGTVDQDTTLYAKWIAEDEVVTQTGHSAYATREAEYVGVESTEGCHVTLEISFDGQVSVSDADALMDSLSITNNATFSAENVSVSDDGTTLVLYGTLSGALAAGTLTADVADGYGVLDGITVDDKPVTLTEIKTLVDTGLSFEAVEVVEGTADTPASTTYTVTSGANVRSMNHIIWLSTAGSTDGTGSSIISNTGTYSQSTTAHHHSFYSMTAVDSAAIIVSNAADTLSALGYTVSALGDGTFTITADEAVEGEILAAFNYSDSFFNETGIAYAEDVTGVDLMPAATGDHEYGDDATFTWSDDYNTCTAEFTCSVCGNASDSVETEIITSYNSDGSITYTAVCASPSGSIVTDAVTVEPEEELTYEDGYADGYADGEAGVDTDSYYNAGYEAGYTAGYADGITEADASGSYLSGYTEGYAAGAASVDANSSYSTGYDEGYTAGYNAGVASVDTDSYYNSGYTAGAASVDTSSYYTSGYEAGYAAGVASVDTDSYYNAGYEAGVASVNTGNYYAEGYTDGYDAAIASLQRAKNTLTVKVKKAITVKASTLKTKSKSFKRSKFMKISKAKGIKTFKKLTVKRNGKAASNSVAKKITVNRCTGKITLKKGLKKGTYKVKIKVKAAGNDNYKSGSKTVTVTIKVK